MPRKNSADIRNTTFVPGFFKIFDEILVNAADNKVCLGALRPFELLD
jgi:hypothetical protein